MKSTVIPCELAKYYFQFTEKKVKTEIRDCLHLKLIQIKRGINLKRTNISENSECGKKYSRVRVPCF